jgi:hypothetical protein
MKLFKVFIKDENFDEDNEFHENYLKNFCENFKISIKNLIEKNYKNYENVQGLDENLEEIFHHARICQRLNSISSINDVAQINEYFNNSSSLPFIITGTSGAGKSTLIAGLCVNFNVSKNKALMIFIFFYIFRKLIRMKIQL